MSLGIWTKQGVVIAAVGSDEPGQPNVLYEAGALILTPNGDGKIFKMWFSTSAGVCYAESNNGTTWSRYSSNPVIAYVGGPYAKLYKNGSTYYCYTLGVNGYTSADGVTWASHGVVLAKSQAWEGTFFYGQLSVLDVIAGTWYAYYTASTSGDTTYAMGLATSPDGLVWTKSASNPIITQGGPSNFCFAKVGSTYYGWSQVVLAGIPQNALPGLPSDISRYYASSPSGPWTYQQISSLIRTTAGEGWQSNGGQVADPSIINVSGTTYMYYTESSDGSPTNYLICCATTSLTLEQLIETPEGVVGYTLTGTAAKALCLRQVASDNFANFTNWATAPGFSPGNTLSGGYIIPASTAANDCSYQTVYTPPADQWASVTVHNCAGGGNVGVLLRQSGTGSTKNTYAVYMNGTFGTGLSIRIGKWVSGAFTQLSSIATGTTAHGVPGDTVTGVVIGTKIYSYFNGALMDVITDVSIASGTAGLLENAIGGTATQTQISAWAAGDIGYSIGGNAGVAGATVSDGTNSATADPSGYYVLAPEVGGPLTITPTLAGKTFSPTTASETVTTANLTGVNFTASAASSGSGSFMQAFRNFVNKRG